MTPVAGAEKNEGVVGQGRRTRYPGRVSEFARRLAEDGRSATYIQAQLQRRGYRPSLSTIRYWVDPDFRKLHLEKQCKKRYPAHKRKQKDTVWWARYRRMVELRGAGLTCAAVAKVMNLDYGLAISDEQVRYALQADTDRARRGRAKHLFGESPKRGRPPKVEP